VKKGNALEMFVMKIQDNHSIKRIYNPSRKEFLELWKQYQPFIINGVVENWDACRKWSNDYLINLCGNTAIPVDVYRENFFEEYKNYAFDKSYKKSEMKLKDYIDTISTNKSGSGIAYYLAQIDFEKYFPELIVDITYPEYFLRKPIIYFWFGYSPTTSVSHLHFDDPHNVFVQIRGRKRIILFPPIDYLSFYTAIEDIDCMFHFSKVNPINPDVESFPKFPWQEKIEVIIEAGEILYIPPFWWHHVTAINENISLSFMYSPKIEDFVKQERLLSTTLRIASHDIPHRIRKLFSSLYHYSTIVK